MSVISLPQNTVAMSVNSPPQNTVAMSAQHNNSGDFHFYLFIYLESRKNCHKNAVVVKCTPFSLHQRMETFFVQIMTSWADASRASYQLSLTADRFQLKLLYAPVHRNTTSQYKCYRKSVQWLSSCYVCLKTLQQEQRQRD